MNVGEKDGMMDRQEASETLEEKIPRTVIRVRSSDHSHRTSPQYSLVRQMSQNAYKEELTNDENEAPHTDSNDSQAHILRYDSTPHSPKEYEINNGLDPIGIELISSTIPASQAGSEYSDKSDDILDYLTSTNESPSRRSRKNKDIPLPDPDEGLEEEIIEDEHLEIESKSSQKSPMNDGGESDSTVALTMEPPSKRRKSLPRSRSTSRNRTPKKSISRLMKDELSFASDRDEGREDDEEDRTSDVSFVTNRSLEGRAVNPPPKPGWDSFCFKCHTDNQVLSLACSKCKCSYHRQCVRPNPIPKNTDDFVCPECLEVENAEDSKLNKYGHEKIDPNTLSELLKIILEKIRTYPDRELLENDIVVKGTKDPQSLITTQMSLKTLEARIKSLQYTATESFIHDIKQLEHNWNIVDRNKTKTFKSIVKYVYTEVNELEACVFCYQQSFVTADWFIQPCNRPHLLIWAKLKGYPYWPAKVMSVDARQHVDVRFFGAHDRAWVPAAHCILFCEQDPNKTKGSTPTGNKGNSKSQKGIVDAIKEKDEYIKRLRDKFGFKYFKFREIFDPSDLHKHLEYMLPGMKSLKENRESQHAVEKDVEGVQKEKLTLKIVKGQSSNYQVEQKQPEKTEKSKQKLYKVLSKNDDNADMEQQGTGKLSLIIKRKSNVEQETEKAKKSKTNENASEASEGHVQSDKQRRKSSFIPSKHKKAARNAEKEKEAMSETPLPTKKSKQSEKHKITENEENLLEEAAKTKKLSRRTRAKSVLPEADKPLLIAALIPLIPLIPPGTDEVQSLKGTSPRKLRSRSLQRSRSVEREVLKEPKKRLSLSATRKNSQRQSICKPAVEKPAPEIFDPEIVVKDEPLSDSEEVVQSDSLSLSVIPNLMQDLNGKKRLIVISTNDDNESSSSQQSGRAKKSFPNKIQLDAITAQQQQQLQNRDGNWMICIPPAAASISNAPSPPTSNRSTPASDPQVSISLVRQNQSNQSRPRVMVANRPSQPTTVTPLNYNSRRDSQLNSNFVNGQTPMNNNQVNDVPRLVPRPQGVFISDGNNFQRDNGPVSRMMADNAHRISDFFKTVLEDTVSAFAPDLPAAENLMLRAENEKLNRDMQLTKSDCQQKMQELRREHQDEIDSLKKSFDERLKNVQMVFEQDKARSLNEVRKQCENEKQRAIEITRRETKKSTWCCNCTKEARFYCCWNTSYCGPQCQRTNWQVHQKYCTNKNSVNEAPQPQQQQMSKQQGNEALTLVTAQSAITARPTATLKSTQQQFPVPVTLQQHLIPPPPQGSAMITTSGIIPNQNQQVFTQNKQYRTLDQRIFEGLPQNLTIHSFQRDNLSNGLLSGPVSETIILQSSNSISTSATTSQN